MKTVIEMALDTGFDADDETTLTSLERFAELVRADERAQRTWVGLTDEQIVAKALHLSGLGTSPDVIQFARAIEAKLKEKNT